MTITSAGPSPESYLAIRPHCLAVASALRWLQKEDPPELSGDDAVGWWLLIEAGSFPPSPVLESMASRLSRLLSGRRIGDSELYTFTALTRTLLRAEYPIQDTTAVYREWSTAMKRFWPSGDTPAALTANHLWLVQMGAEFWPEELRRRGDIIECLLASPDPKQVFAANGLLLGSALGVPLDVARRNGTAQSILDSITADAGAFTDWELSYLGRTAAITGDERARSRVSELLIDHQTDGAWDAQSEECVESTSLCGIAMIEMAAMELSRGNLALARSAVIHQSLLFRDRARWLRSRFDTLRTFTDPNRKGQALESLIKEWIQADRSLRVTNHDLRGGTDEIDLVVEVLGSSTLADDIAPARFVLIECKNTANPTGARDVRAFRDSLSSRRDETCQLGIYVSHAGFTDDATRLAREDFGHGKVLVLLAGEEIARRLAMRQTFSQVIHHMFQDGVLRRP